MNHIVASILMMNNYFHDVATAMVPATAAVAWMLLNMSERATKENEQIVYLRVYKLVVKIFVFSLFWLMIGAIPRVLTFRAYELKEAQMKGIVIALFAKLIVAFVLVVIGSLMWIKIGRRLKEMS
jgi:Kef-type K+ transport system membrane component KefB